MISCLHEEESWVVAAGWWWDDGSLFSLLGCLFISFHADDDEGRRQRDSGCQEKKTCSPIFQSRCPKSSPGFLKIVFFDLKGSLFMVSHSWTIRWCRDDDCLTIENYLYTKREEDERSQWRDHDYGGDQRNGNNNVGVMIGIIMTIIATLGSAHTKGRSYFIEFAATSHAANLLVWSSEGDPRDPKVSFGCLGGLHTQPVQALFLWLPASSSSSSSLWVDWSSNKFFLGAADHDDRMDPRMGDALSWVPWGWPSFPSSRSVLTTKREEPSSSWLSDAVFTWTKTFLWGTEQKPWSPSSSSPSASSSGANGAKRKGAGEQLKEQEHERNTNWEEEGDKTVRHHHSENSAEEAASRVGWSDRGERERVLCVKPDWVQQNLAALLVHASSPLLDWRKLNPGAGGEGRSDDSFSTSLLADGHVLTSSSNRLTLPLKSRWRDSSELSWHHQTDQQQLLPTLPHKLSSRLIHAEIIFSCYRMSSELTWSHHPDSYTRVWPSDPRSEEDDVLSCRCRRCPEWNFITRSPDHSEPSSYKIFISRTVTLSVILCPVVPTAATIATSAPSESPFIATIDDGPPESSAPEFSLSSPESIGNGGILSLHPSVPSILHESTSSPGPEPASGS